MNPFRPGVLAALIAVGTVSLTSTLLLLVFGGGSGTADPREPDSYNLSAIGHHAFVALLRERGVPVLVSHHASARKAGPSGVLVLCEPDIREERRATLLRQMVEQASRVLLVLPKWAGEPDPDRPGWVADLRLRGEPEIEAVLAAAGVRASVTRPEGGEPDWSPGRPEPALPRLQLVQGGDLAPRIGTAGGVLLGSRGGLHVLSDPDLLSNHGLMRGENARIVLDAIEEVRGREGAVVIDETLHGRETPPDIWSALFRFPLVLVTAHVALTLAVLLWATTGRFGAPVPLPPPLPSGKRALVESTAGLLRYGGHSAHALRCYLDTAVREVAKELHAPAGLAERDLPAWLERTGEARGVEARLSALRARIKPEVLGARPREAEIVRAALRIHRWRREMTDGTEDGPGDG